MSSTNSRQRRGLSEIFLSKVSSLKPKNLLESIFTLCSALLISKETYIRVAYLKRDLYIHYSQESSWMRVVDPVYTLLFDLNPKLWTQLLWIFTDLSEPGSISADFQGTGSIPAGFQECCRADTVLRDLWKRCFWAKAFTLSLETHKKDLFERPLHSFPRSIKETFVRGLWKRPFSEASTLHCLRLSKMSLAKVLFMSYLSVIGLFGDR